MILLCEGKHDVLFVKCLFRIMYNINIEEDFYIVDFNKLKEKGGESGIILSFIRYKFKKGLIKNEKGKDKLFPSLIEILRKNTICKENISIYVFCDNDSKNIKEGNIPKFIKKVKDNLVNKGFEVNIEGLQLNDYLYFLKISRKNMTISFIIFLPSLEKVLVHFGYENLHDINNDDQKKYDIIKNFINKYNVYYYIENIFPLS